MVVLGPVVTGVDDDDQFSSSGRRLTAWRRCRERQSMEEGREDRRQHGNILRASEQMGRDGVDAIDGDERWPKVREMLTIRPAEGSSARFLVWGDQHSMATS
jgi:hypothetical protein